MERDEYARLRLSLKKIKEEVSHIEQTIEDIKIRKITEGLTYAEWAASHDNQPSVEDTLERIGTNHDVQSDKSIQEALVEKEEIGMLMLKLIEIIGTDDIQNLDPETLYFIVNLLNKAEIKKVRNRILNLTLPLRV